MASLFASPERLAFHFTWAEVEDEVQLLSVAVLSYLDCFDQAIYILLLPFLSICSGDTDSQSKIDLQCFALQTPQTPARS